jgi:hypothetical protein
VVSINKQIMILRRNNSRGASDSFYQFLYLCFLNKILNDEFCRRITLAGDAA